MTDRTTSDLAALLTPAPSAGVQFAQGTILTWDRERLENTIEWRGVTLRDIPMIEGLNNLVLKPGDVVGLLGWAPENSKGIGSWWILGKLSNPGEFIADLTFFLGQVRFRTQGDEYDQVYFGSDTAGNPLTILYYGDAGSTRALQIINRNAIQIKDPSNNEIFGNDAGSGVGISRPWLPYLMSPTTTATQSGTTYLPATTNAAYTAIWRGFNPIFHPRIAYGVNMIATGTPGWQIRMDDGTGLVVVASGTGSASGTFNVPGWGTTTNPASVREIVLEARNTGGGTTHIGIDRLYGRQS